jgi:hypothetical protein
MTQPDKWTAVAWKVTNEEVSQMITGLEFSHGAIVQHGYRADKSLSGGITLPVGLVLFRLEWPAKALPSYDNKGTLEILTKELFDEHVIVKALGRVMV